MENTNRKDRYCCGNYWFYRIMYINHRTYNPVGTYVQKKIMAIKKQPLFWQGSLVRFDGNICKKPRYVPRLFLNCKR